MWNRTDILCCRELKVERATKRQYLPEVPGNPPEDTTELQNDKEMPLPDNCPKEEREREDRTTIMILNDDAMLCVFSYLTLRERIQAERGG